MLSELLYADDLVLISGTIDRLRNKSFTWRKAFESKGLNVELGQTKVIVSGGISKDGLSKSQVDPCGLRRLRVKANSVLCIQCGELFHSRCSDVKRVTAAFSRMFYYRKCEGNIGKVVFSITFLTNCGTITR